jgi:poly-gamma-glutamate capsule biosynthesis protein CapA/YwtB (metallophosphatase superfamily)
VGAATSAGRLLPKTPAALPAAVAALALMLSVYAEGTRVAAAEAQEQPTAPAPQAEPPPPVPLDEGPSGELTLAFAGDVHFENHLADLLARPQAGLGPIDRALGAADLTMVNLESAITARGRPAAKELELPSLRHHFRTSPAALDVLAAAGVDVVTMANNHGADYGPVGFTDTLAAVRTGPIPVLGVGEDRRAAFTPYLASIRGTDLAFLAADDSRRESAQRLWAAGPDHRGLAAAHSDRGRALLAAVRRASRQADVVVVYMHWGQESQSCPTARQRFLASALTGAGADVIVGSHAHVLLGSGWLGESYVNYGLANFVWYHNLRPMTGVLTIRIRDGKVVDDAWSPARILTHGRPVPLRPDARGGAIADWRQLRGCADLAPQPPA